LRAPAIGEAAGVADADVGAGTAFDAVIARELVALKERACIEHQRLSVFVRNTKPACIRLVRTDEDLAHWLQDMRGAGGREQDRPAHLKAGSRHGAVIVAADVLYPAREACHP